MKKNKLLEYLFLIVLSILFVNRDTVIPVAQQNLAYMYEKGIVVSRDDAEAVSWYRKAAERGLADAQINLGVMYAEGSGVPQDYAEEMKWFRMAAEQGLAEAQYNLGVMYGNGEGVPHDYKTAYIWLSIAAANMSGELQKDAADTRDRVAKRLSPAALKEAQQIASEWKPKKWGE